MKRTFFIKALWDEEAKVWYSETDIVGLFINAKDLNEFEEVINEFAGDLVLENHWRHEQVPEELMKTTVPIILWQRPSIARQDSIATWSRSCKDSDMPIQGKQRDHMKNGAHQIGKLSSFQEISTNATQPTLFLKWLAV